MPNPSELERLEQEQRELEAAPVVHVSALPFWRAHAWRHYLRYGQWKERLAIWIAWRLPKRIVLWAMIRVAAHATTGRWGNEHPGNVDYRKMHDRWSIDNG